MFISLSAESRKLPISCAFNSVASNISNSPTEQITVPGFNLKTEEIIQAFSKDVRI